ncbi:MULTISPECIES: hypothetical protein [unclassified Streptomyces]|uniref:hypothetical protein n=1 Tax=unclassified Streptomyces TaxID=2593676 RepID=UPI0035DB9546
MPQPPVRVGIDSAAPYLIMWLAGVRNVNLDRHCLESFGVSDRHPVNARAPRQSVTLPAENPPLAWYLCALPHPWDWSKNAHLPFEYAEGHQWKGPALVRGLQVTLENARPITGWGEQSIPATAPKRGIWRYRTCRNWQFAWWLRTNREAPDAPPSTWQPPEDPNAPQQLTFP